MSAHKLQSDLDDCLRAGFASVNDPGDAGSIEIERVGAAICEIVTAGAETRALESAANLPVGQRLLVIGKTLAGAATITGSDKTVMLTTAGDSTEFAVACTKSGDVTTNVWRLLSYSPASAVAMPVTLTYNFLATETAADAVAGFMAVIGQLADAGLVNDDAVLNTAI